MQPPKIKTEIAIIKTIMIEKNAFKFKMSFLNGKFEVRGTRTKQTDING